MTSSRKPWLVILRARHKLHRALTLADKLAAVDIAVSPQAAAVQPSTLYFTIVCRMTVNISWDVLVVLSYRLATGAANHLLDDPALLALVFC